MKILLTVVCTGVLISSYSQTTQLYVPNGPTGVSGVGTVASGTGVGIGTANPVSNAGLDIEGGVLNIGGTGSADAMIHIKSSANALSNRLTQMCPSINQGSTIPALNLMASLTSGSPQWWSWGVLSGGNWSFQPSSDFGGSAGMFINRSGYVGIGTSSPGAPLHVNTEEIGPGLLVSGGNASYKDIRTINPTTGKMWQWSHRPLGDGETFEAWHHTGTNWLRVMTMTPSGNVGIGTNLTNGYKLAVEGTIGAREVNVNAATWSDYVFNDDYKLPSLETVEKYINQYHHLPEVPLEKDVKERGVNVGEMNALLLKKIEELTLYVIDLKKEVDQLKRNK